jgi:hypothetical protein
MKRRGPRDPQDEAALLAVADAYDAVQRSGLLSKQQLRTVVDGASNNRMLVWAGSTDLLMALSAQFAEVAAAILNMSQHRQAHVRFNALCCLGKKTPTDTVHAVIKAGLIDKSSRVRRKAADRAHTLRAVELVPEITAALKAEKHDKTRATIEFELRLLRDGFIVNVSDDGQFDVTVSYPGGICGRTVSAKEMKSRGMEAVVADMRRACV